MATAIETARATSADPLKRLRDKYGTGRNMMYRYACEIEQSMGERGLITSKSKK